MHKGHIAKNCPICLALAKPGAGKIRAHLAGKLSSAELRERISAKAKAAGMKLEPCAHLGKDTGKQVDCTTCKGKKLKVFACSEFGECTILKAGKGVGACCAGGNGMAGSCLKYTPTTEDAAPTLDQCPADMTRINHGAGGLGDALLGLCVMKSMQASGQRIAYAVHPDAIPFLELFDGYGMLARHVHDKTEPAKPSKYLQLNLGYQLELVSRAAIPRWERYARNVGASNRPILPVLREPERLRALAEQYADAVVLAPFSTWSNREWRIESWLTLETLLTAAGYRVVILDKSSEKRPGKAKDLISEKVIDASPDIVTGICLVAAAVVGNDSGIAHLAGILGTPTVAICGQTTGEDIFGLYPRVMSLQGKLECSGCWWQPPYEHGRCESTCAAMQSILPGEVLRAVDSFTLESYAGGASILGWEKLATIRDAVLATNRLPGDVAEFGVYKGGTAKLIGRYAPKAKLHLFDTFEGMPADDIHQAGHRRGDFADCSEEAVRTTIGNPRAVFHQGHFPEGAPDEVRYRFAHVDMDIEQSTAAAIEYLRPRMVPGGIVVFDDYSWPHCPGVFKAIHANGLTIERPTLHQAVVRF